MKQEHFELASASLDVLVKSFEEDVMVKCPVKTQVRVRRSRGSCATMAIVTPDYTHYCPNQACHAGLNNRGYDGFPGNGKDRVAVISTIQNHNMDDVSVNLFVDYLVNNSMYRDAFVSKDVEFIINKGFICRTDVPSNLLAGALIASRRISEYDFVLKGWRAMMEAGVNADAAFALAHVFKFLSGKVSVGRSSGHCSIDGYIMNFETMHNMMAHDMKNPNRNYNEDSSYGGVHNLFATRTNADDFNNWIAKLMAEAKKVKREVKKAEVKRDIPLNPFKLAPKARGDHNEATVTQERFLEELIDLLPKEFLNV
ncbi:MAG: hypothetical protein ACRC91_04725 [Aeromonas sp.]